MSSPGFSWAWNGSGSALLRTSMCSATTSTLPVRILSFTAWRAHRAGDAQAVFVTDLGRRRDHLGIARRIRGLGNDLDDAFVVAQVDEAQPAEVAGDICPAAQGHALADQRLVA